MWRDTTEAKTLYSDHTQSYEAPEFALNAGDTGICVYEKGFFPHLQALGKLRAMLRGEGSQEEMRVGSQHGRIWAWVQQPLGHT